MVIEAFDTISPSQKYHHLECFEILYTFTTTCYKNNVKISGQKISKSDIFEICPLQTFFNNFSC